MTSSVLTRSGWKKFRELEVGTEVATENGYSEIVGLSKIQKVQIYKITTDDGRVMRCGEDHLFKVKIPSNSCLWKIISLKKIMALRWKTDRVDNRDGKTHTEYRTRLQPIPFLGQESDPPIDPYTLGVWLGDGTTTCGQITTDDPEILQYIPYKAQKNKAKFMYGIYGLIKELRKVGLLGHKHIPESYFWLSYSQRLELLRGLMDTDGTYHKEYGIAYFCNTNRELINGIIRLVRSLGGVAKISVMPPPQKVEHKQAWQVSIKLHDNPFGLARKAVNYTGLKRELTLKIVDIVPDGKEEARCIKIADPSGMYITDTYFPTHNTSLFTQGDSLRESLVDPNIRILINSAGIDLSRKMLTAIRGHLGREDFQEIYGSLVPGSSSSKEYKNNRDELTLLNRTNLSLREATFTCSGLEASKTSQHYDLIFHDDLVNRENVSSYEMMDKVWKIWQDSLDLLEPDGRMIVIGTRWSPQDLYGRILKDYVDQRCFDGQTTHHVAGCKCLFDVSILILRDDKGNYIFDSKFDDAVVDSLKTIKGIREFSSQYENNPSSPEGSWFGEVDIENTALISPAEIEAIRHKLIWYMIVDPAESIERRSSFTAVVGVGVDPETGMIYVDMARQERVDTAGFITLIFDCHKKLKPHYFYIEKNTRKALEYVLKDKMSTFNHHFTIQEVNPILGKTSHAKETRVRSLVPLFESGRIKINSTLHDLISILSTIPAANSWDLADVLSYILQVAPKGLGGELVTPDARPAKVVQNKGLSYVTRRNRARSSHRITGPTGPGTFPRTALRCIYSASRIKRRGKVPVMRTAKGAAGSQREVHGSPVSGNVIQVQTVPEHS
jgi:hypothetical protein